MNDLVSLDPTFTESSFKTKVDNIFVMLHMSLMTDNMKRVDHFISDNVYEEFSNRLNVLNSNNERQMFDELNVKSTDIIKVDITNDKYIITDKGRVDGELTQDSIAFTVKQRAENAVARYNRQLRRSSFVKTQIIPRDTGDFSVMI